MKIITKRTSYEVKKLMGDISYQKGQRKVY